MLAGVISATTQGISTESVDTALLLSRGRLDPSDLDSEGLLLDLRGESALLRAKPCTSFLWVTGRIQH